MINEISIRSTYGTDVDTKLAGVFIDKASRKKITLLHDFSVLIDVEPTSSQRVWEHEFKKNRPIFDISWKSSDEKMVNFVKYLKKHPLLDHASNINKDAKTYFLLIDKSEADRNTYMRDKQRNAAFNMLSQMNYTEMRNVAYFNLIDPGERNAIGLFNYLAAFDSGLVMQNPLKFINEWKMPVTAKKTVIRKAILLNIIDSEKTSTGTIYKINQTPIGNVDNLVVYFEEKPEMYKFLLQQVAEKDLLPIEENEKTMEEILSDAPKAEKKDTTISKDQKEINKVQREAAQQSVDVRKNIQVERLKELKVSAWMASGSWTEETRLKKIKEAESALVMA